MPTISITSTDLNNRSLVLKSWTPLATGDDGAPFSFGQYTDRTIQVTGTFLGATVTIQGSLDNSNWATLTDPLGNPLTFTSAGLKAVCEATPYLRPVVTGGTATAIVVRLFGRE